MAKLILRFFIILVISLGAFAYANCQCTVTATNDTSVCSALSGIQLNAIANNTIGYRWAPVTGLSNANIANPIASPTVTTKYIVTAVIPDNTELVTNGNFESGNTGFSSSYTYVSNPAPVTNNLLEGEYTVKANPSTTHQCFAACSDKTSGSGNMMIFNGSKTANVSVWSQTISVTPNTDYAFSAWLQNVTCPPYGYNAELQFSINNSLLGNVFRSDSAICKWKQFFQVWNSGSNTSATISIVNQYTNANGNDFALDDISFRKLCPAKDTVTITVGKRATKNITICNGDSIFLQKRYRKTTGTYYDTIAAIGCDSIITSHLTVSGNTFNTIDTTICGGDSILINNRYIKIQGTYNDTVGFSGSCYNINETTITVHNATHRNINKLLCGIDSFYFDNRFIKNTGTYYDTIYREHCMDTVTRLDLTIKVPPVTIKNIAICSGDSIFLQKGYRKTSGTYYDTLTSGGCDSIISSYLTVSNNTINTIDTTICGEDSILINNRYIKISGTYNDTISFSGNCYLINETTITVHNTTHSSISRLLCGIDSFYFDNRFIKSSGTYFDTVYRKHCLDTIKRLDLTVKAQPINYYEFRICPGDSIFWEGSFVKTDTTLYDTIPVVNSCDSMVITTVKVMGVPPNLPDTAFYCENNALLDAGVFRSYLWNDGTSGRFLSTNTDGLYWVQITDTNNCKFTDTSLVLERCDPRFFVPSAFTPNNDGKNDYFSIYTYNINDLKFLIFDRWGEILYEAKDPGFVWDATYKDKPLPTGIYHWLASFTGINRDGRIVKQTQRGMITLIR